MIKIQMVKKSQMHFQYIIRNVKAQPREVDLDNIQEIAIRVLRYMHGWTGDQGQQPILETVLMPRGLEKHQINSFPTRLFSSSISLDSNTFNKTDTGECSVCLSEYMNDDLLRTIPCCHEFHVACIDKWLELRNTCPVCRSEITRDQPERSICS